MSETVQEMLAREAAEARAVAEAEGRGERAPARGQRARRNADGASQVYSVRIPVDRIAQLRRLAETRGVAPTALLRQFVLERLDIESDTANAPSQLSPSTLAQWRERQAQLREATLRTREDVDRLYELLTGDA
jgi:phage terminase small subunit